jgi:von Willebrand factor A domain-containing protein 7
VIKRQNRVSLSRLALYLGISAFMALPGGVALAFKPTAGHGHVGIVREAVTPITRTSSTGETLRFSARAMEQIRDATAGVDEVFSARGELSVPNAHCDDELMPACSQRIISIKNAVIANLAGGSPDGAAGRAQVGRALHTLQDFYSHSNWVNAPGPGNAGHNPALGRSVIGALPVGVQTCVDDFFDRTLIGAGLTSLTTGYFTFEPPAGKCAHGILPGTGTGIHKDSPGRPFHAQARAAAVAGTADLINQILDAPGVAGNDDAIKAFMDVRGTLGFVVDDTGSMGPDIAGVKAVVQQIVGAVAGTDDAPDHYLLVRFGDPDIGAPFKTSNPSALLAAVNALSPDGGGDCPELSQGGLLSALSATSSRSKLYLFTDASAKDAALAGNVTATANAKKTTINYVVTGSCSPIDPVYFRVAQETGGQVFVIRRSEVSQIFHLIQPSLSGDLQPILTLDDRFDVPQKIYAVPVDSTIRQITFSVSGETLSNARIVRPSGADVDPSSPGVVFTRLLNARIYTIDAPEAGNWSVVAQGGGPLSVAVLGNSPIELADVAAVEVSGREEHEGLFPLQGQPLVGEITLLRARMFGPASSVTFERVALDGMVLSTLPLSPGAHDDAAADEYVGATVIPVQPFRIYARGTDLAGNEFRRVYPPVFRGQSVKVQAVASDVTLQPGTTANVEFEVTNLGAPVSFVITASDEAGFVRDATLPTIALGTDASATVSVALDVPDLTTRDSNVVTLVARSAANADVTNSASLGLQIGVADSDGDGLPDDADECPASDLRTTLMIGNCDTGATNISDSQGCSLSDRITLLGLAVRNHGEFVSRVTEYTGYLHSQNILTSNQRGRIHSCAARVPHP